MKIICHTKRRLRLLFGLFVFAAILPLAAQREVPKNLPYVDLKPYHFGFYLGMDMQDLRMVNHGLPTSDGRVLFGDQLSWSPGFTVGFIANFNLGANFNLRVLPGLHFGDRPIAFSDGEKEIERFSLRSNYLTLPVELRYSALRLNNIRPYISAGVYGSMELGRKKLSPLMLQTFDFGLSASIGCDFYLPFFKLSPQLTFRYGLPNALERKRPDLEDNPLIVYTEALKRCSTRMIMLTFNFE